MTVQADHEVLPGQVRRSDPDQHLPGRWAPVAGLSDISLDQIVPSTSVVLTRPR